MVKLCVFDMDGLLLETERVLYLNNELSISKELGYDLSDEFFRSLMGGSWADYPDKIKQKAGKGFPYDTYIKELWRRIDDTLENGVIPLRPGAKDILEYCKKNNIFMAIATSTHSERAIKCLKNSGIHDLFDYIVTGDMVEKGKPDPEIFLKAISHFNIDKKDAIVFEDGHNGSLAARNGDLRLIIVEDLAYISQEDRKYALLTLNSLDQAIDFIRRENETTSSI